jgi:large subunit ribosomal protein L2
MATKSRKPTTNSQRYYSVSAFDDVTASKPERSLVEPLKRKGGRNNTGRITSRHRGGGHKRRYRTIDFRRDKREQNGTIVSIEYDPNRSSRIALVEYEDSDRRYILAPDKLRVGDTVRAGEDIEFKHGNAGPLSIIPLGTFVHNVELKPGKGGQICRSAGTAAQVVAREGKFATLRLPSGEMRMVHTTCYVTIGTLSNTDHSNISYGKAGRIRWMGIRPQTRGMAMNPVDHPNGGGEGRSKSGGGRQHPRSPWGKYAKGQKTRRKKKASSRYIVRRRKEKKL